MAVDLEQPCVRRTMLPQAVSLRVSVDPPARSAFSGGAALLTATRGSGGQHLASPSASLIDDHLLGCIWLGPLVPPLGASWKPLGVSCVGLLGVPAMRFWGSG